MQTVGGNVPVAKDARTIGLAVDSSIRPCVVRPPVHGILWMLLRSIRGCTVLRNGHRPTNTP